MAKDSSLSSFKAEYLRQKAIQKEKHKHSRLRHPVKATKRGYNNVSNTTSTYWQKGKEIGNNRMKYINGDKKKYKPRYYYGDKDVAKYLFKHSTKKQKIGTVLVIIFIIAMVVIGVLNG